MRLSVVVIAGITMALLIAAGGCNVTTANGGTGGTGATAVISRGTISDIGSIWVNGVRYDTTGATITLADGSTVSDPEGTAGGTLLRKGMLVTLTGDRNGGVGQASRVSYHRSLLGPVADVTLVAGLPSSVGVLGQRVLIDVASGFTRLEPPDWVPAPHEWVEVSGFDRPDGRFHASYLRRIGPQAEVQIAGVVTAVDLSAWTCTVNGATAVVVPVDYDLPALVPGSHVVVDGVPGPFAGVVLASAPPRITDPQLEGAPGMEAEVEGVVTASLASSEFVVAGQGVTVTGETRFEGGSLADVVVGSALEVHGTLAADGRLEATEVRFRDTIEIQAVIDGYAAASGTFTLVGLGITLVVHVDADLTRLADGLSLADRQPVKLRGRAIPPATHVLATTVETGNAEAIRLQGVLEQVAADLSSLRLLGTDVMVAGIQRFELNESVVDAASFFAQVLPGQLVALEGVYADGGITWSTLALAQ